MSLQFLNDAAEDLQIFRYTLVATTFLVSYEHIVNFDNEVRFLWRRGFTFAGVLLFLCRYLTILAVYFAMYNHVWTTNVTHSNCVHLITGNTLLVWFQFCLTNLILLVRAYAVWGGSRRILVLLAFAWIAGIGGTSITVVKYIKSAVPVGIKYGGGGCVYTIGDNSVKYSIIDHTFNDLMSLGLLLYKSVHHARAMKSQIPIRRRDGRPTANLLTVMAQDGIIYFVLNLAVSVANYIVIEKASVNLRDFMFGTQGALQCILCSKLLFHLYTVGQSLSSTTSYATFYSATSTLQFGSGTLASASAKQPSTLKKSSTRAVHPSEADVSFEMERMDYNEDGKDVMTGIESVMEFCVPPEPDYRRRDSKRDMVPP